MEENESLEGEVVEEVVEETVEEVDESPKSLRDTIADAWDAQEGEESEDSEDDIEASSETDLETTSDDALDTEADEPPIEYPSAWSDELKQKVSEGPKEFQKWAADWTKKNQATITQVLQRNAAVEKLEKENVEVRQAVAPYESRIRQRGHTVGQRVGYLLELDEQLGTNPQATILYLCNEVGLDPAQLAQSNAPADPQLARIMQEQEQLKRSYEAERRAREEQQAQLQRQHLTASVDSFGQAKDAQGAPLRPHWDLVWNEMTEKEGAEAVSSFIRGVKAMMPDGTATETVLDKAYRLAAAQSEKVAALNRKKAEEAALANKAKKAKEAKRTSVRRTGPSASGMSKTRPKTLRGQLEQAWAELS